MVHMDDEQTSSAADKMSANYQSHANRHHDGLDLIRGAIADLSYSAKSLDRVGLTRVAEELDFAIGAIERGLELVRSAYSDQLTEAVRYSEETAYGLLSLAVNGCLKPAERSDAAQSNPSNCV